jgi:virginiamycin B lyase
VLRQYGYPPGIAGCEALAARMQKAYDWAIIAFVTKYPLFQSAYASGPRLCIQYQSDGAGADVLDRVLAHQVCTLFGAADEYGSCGCGPSGYFSVPNGNCVNCTKSQVPCLMNSDILSLCPWSRGQSGWSTWLQVQGNLANVSCAADGTVWGVSSHDKIYRYTGSTWVQIPGTMKSVSVGSATNVWALDGSDQDNIHKYTGSGWQKVSGNLADISVAADGTVWGVNSQDAVFYLSQSSGWQAIDGALRSISVGSAQIIWGVNKDGFIFKRSGSTWENVTGPSLADIAAAADGTVWGATAGGAIYRYDGSSWQLIDGSLQQLSVASSSAVWGVNGFENVYRRIVAAT